MDMGGGGPTEQSQTNLDGVSVDGVREIPVAEHPHKGVKIIHQPKSGIGCKYFHLPINDGVKTYMKTEHHHLTLSHRVRRPWRYALLICLEWVLDSASRNQCAAGHDR